jgi:hypothetical protein
MSVMEKLARIMLSQNIYKGVNYVVRSFFCAESDGLRTGQ